MSPGESDAARARALVQAGGLAQWQGTSGAAAWAEGEAMTLEQAVAYALEGCANG